MKSAPFPGNQSSLEILQMLETVRYQSGVKLLFSSVMILIEDESDGTCLVERDNPVLSGT